MGFKDKLKRTSKLFILEPKDLADKQSKGEEDQTHEDQYDVEPEENTHNEPTEAEAPKSEQEPIDVEQRAEDAVESHQPTEENKVNDHAPQESVTQEKVQDEVRDSEAAQSGDQQNAPEAFTENAEQGEVKQQAESGEKAVASEKHEAAEQPKEQEARSKPAENSKKRDILKRVLTKFRKLDSTPQKVAAAN